MRAEHDMTANALYLALREEPAAKTIQLDESTLVDLDARGKLVGIEVLDPSRQGWVGLVLDRFGDKISTMDRKLIEAMYGGARPQPLPQFQAEILGAVPA